MSSLSLFSNLSFVLSLGLLRKMVTMVWKIVNSIVPTDNLADILQTCTIYLNLGNEIS